jgi:hypothetical protein
MNQLAIWIVAGIQMRTVSETFVRLLIDYSSEMLLVTQSMSFGFLTAISGTVIAILEVFLCFKLQSLNLFFVAAVFLKLNNDQSTCTSMSIFSLKREGAFSKLSISSFYSFSLGVAYLFCC